MAVVVTATAATAAALDLEECPILQKGEKAGGRWSFVEHTSYSRTYIDVLYDGKPITVDVYGVLSGYSDINKTKDGKPVYDCRLIASTSHQIDIDPGQDRRIRRDLSALANREYTIKKAFISYLKANRPPEQIYDTMPGETLDTTVALEVGINSFYSPFTTKYGELHHSAEVTLKVNQIPSDMEKRRIITAIIIDGKQVQLTREGLSNTIVGNYYLMSCPGTVQMCETANHKIFITLSAHKYVALKSLSNHATTMQEIKSMLAEASSKFDSD